MVSVSISLQARGVLKAPEGPDLNLYFRWKSVSVKKKLRGFKVKN